MGYIVTGIRVQAIESRRISTTTGIVLRPLFLIGAHSRGKTHWGEHSGDENSIKFAGTLHWNSYIPLLVPT